VSGAPALTLFEHPFALFCQKVLIALYERGLPFTRAIENEDFTREELAALWPMAGIPVLRDDVSGRVVAETSIIIEELDAVGDAPPLVPADRDAALATRRWDRFCDQYVAGPVQDIVGDALRPADRRDPERVDAARATLDTAYGTLDARLARTTWLAGEAFTMADCAAAPALFYAFVVHAWSDDERPSLTRYYRALAARPSYARVLEEARPYRELFPLPWPADTDRHHVGHRP
jgi:glutathione S-transferase